MHPVFTIKDPNNNNKKELIEKLIIPLDIYSKRVLYEVS